MSNPLRLSVSSLGGDERFASTKIAYPSTTAILKMALSDRGTLGAVTQLRIFLLSLGCN